ncbi:MAG: MOSC domain-containing protein [Chloroflexi bacterium]|nr:MOSC domain-containing protein [Chloroflexota bacterium]
MQGTAIGLFTTSGAGQPMVSHETVSAVAGRGLAGDRYHDGIGYYSQRPSEGGGRELTLIATEVLDALAAEHGIRLTLEECRRNVVTRGLDVLTLIGKRFKIGEVECYGVRICEPCTYLEGLTGKPVNAPLVHRAGLRANILVGGTIRLGDVVVALPDAAADTTNPSRAATATAPAAGA